MTADTTTGQVEPPAPPEDGASAAHDEHTLSVISYKILLAWLRNRYRAGFSLTTNLKALTQEQLALLADSMVAAARADGLFDDTERERLEAAWNLIDADGTARSVFAAALESPRPLHDILDAARDVQGGALVYAGTLLAIDRQTAVHRHYLGYLAARLHLSRELIGELRKRFAK